MELLSSVWPGVKATAIVWAFSLSLMTALELVLPRDRYPASGRLKGVLFWALWLIVSGIAYALFGAAWRAIGVGPLIVLPTGTVWAGALSGVIAPLIGAVVYDFFFYWCHRAEHRWLWRFHAVHHSIREMSAVNAFHHPTEPFIQIVLIMIPTSLIALDAAPVFPAMLVLIQLQAAFIHSSTTVHAGPLRWLFVDNRFHRIHHSVEQRHFDHNFGAMTTIWDQLFGTAWMPAADEWPATGIAEVDQPRTVRDWVMLPADYAAAGQAATSRPPVAPDTLPAII